MSETKTVEDLKDLLQVADVGITWMNRALDAESKLADLITLHPASEWTEAEGAVLWWRKQASGQMGEPTVAYMPLEEYGFDFWSRIPRVEVPR